MKRCKIQTSFPAFWWGKSIFQTAKAREKEENSPKTEKKEFSMQNFVKTLYQQQEMKNLVNLEKMSSEELPRWNSAQIAFALQTEHQDVILQEIAQNTDFENLDWKIVQKCGMPIWVKDLNYLQKTVENVAKTVYKLAASTIEFGKGSRAEKTAMWYIAVGKKSILCNLYKQEPASKKVHDMLLNDFTLPRWKSAAEKNAMVLMSKKNYELSIAFFLLAQNLDFAV